MSCAATGKGICPRSLLDYGSGINQLQNLEYSMGGMVLMTSNSHRGSPGSIPWKSQIYSSLLPQNCACKKDGGERSRGCVQVTSAGCCRMRGILSHGGEKIIFLIAAAKYRSMRKVCNRPVFME